MEENFFSIFIAGKGKDGLHQGGQAKFPYYFK